MDHTTHILRPQIAKILEDTIERPVVIATDTNIVRDLGLDSLAVMNFCMALEDRFDVSMPLDEISAVQTIGDLESLLVSLGAKANA